MLIQIAVTTENAMVEERIHSMQYIVEQKFCSSVQLRSTETVHQM